MSIFLTPAENVDGGVIPGRIRNGNPANKHIHLTYRREKMRLDVRAIA